MLKPNHKYNDPTYNLKNHLTYISNFKLFKKYAKLKIVIYSIEKPTFQKDTMNIPWST